MKPKKKLKGPIFIGRGWKEYIKMFNLNEVEISGKRILDCAAGASSFTAHMAGKGCYVRAFDILYNLAPLILKTRCQEHLEILIESLSQMEKEFVWTNFTDLNDMKEQRLESCLEFSRDYKENPERYIEGNVNDLPFQDNEFHISLSSHLLFIYDHRLDFDFHLESILEMLRVSSDELRIYPLVKHHGKKSEFLAPVLKELEDFAISEIKEVDYQFRKGGNEMLVLKKK